MSVGTERALSGSPHVYSARLARGVPDWRIHGKGYGRFRQDAAKRAKRWACELMVRTDVKAYYPSISIDKLASYLLTEIRCRYGPTAFFLERVLYWQLHGGLKGLPVGPEACAIPGTIFLKRVDDEMIPVTDGYYRYTDDIVYFVNHPGLGDLLPVFDAALGERGLMRGVEKTEVHDDPIAAREAIERRLFASLSNGLSNGSPFAMRAVKREFINEVVEGAGNARDFRWYVRVFSNRGDPFAMHWLVEDWNRFNIDPRTSADYFSRCGLSDHDLVDRAIEKLGRVSTDSTAGTDVHLLRVFSRTSMGADERKVFESMAVDPGRAPEVRSWAWAAAAACSGFSADDAVEAAAEEKDPAVRRGTVLALRGKPSRIRNWALRDIARKYSETAPACTWALAA